MLLRLTNLIISNLTGMAVETTTMVTTGGAHLDRDQGQKVVAEHMGVMISNKMVITNFKTKDHIEIAHHHHYKFKREVKLI